MQPKAPFVLLVDDKGSVVGLTGFGPHAPPAPSLNDVIGKRLWELVQRESEKRRLRDLFGECRLLKRSQRAQALSDFQIFEKVSLEFIPLRGLAEVVIVVTPDLDTHLPLNEDDLKLIRLLMADMGMEAIATAQKIRPGAVRTRLARLREKLGVRTNHGIVSTVLAAGIH